MKQEQFDHQWLEFVNQSFTDGRFSPTVEDQIPILDDDKHQFSPHLDFDYLLHGAWAARQLAKMKPKRHVDIGSYCYFAAMCSAFIPVEFYDIRPLEVDLSGLICGSADLTKLPFADNSIESLSCMHTIEHIGLGRYGDKLDAQGDLKAARELVRVLAPGGRLYIVQPMNETPRINFNAHRIYSVMQVHNMFAGLRMLSHTNIIGNATVEGLQPPQGCGYTGCMEFTKV